MEPTPEPGPPPESAVQELYGVAPEEFIETRGRLATAARTAGDRELARRLQSQRRPTLSAWAVNLVARRATADLDELMTAGARLRAAWAHDGHGGAPDAPDAPDAADAAEFGELERRRGELIDRLVRRARALAEDTGRPLRDPAVREVEETLQAATVDEHIAAEVRAGCLDRPYSHSGFTLPAPADRPSTSPAEPRGTRSGRDRARADRGPAPPRTRRGLRVVTGDRDDGRAPAESATPRTAAGNKATAEAEAKAAAQAARAEAEATVVEWEARRQAAERELAAIDQEAQRLRTALDLLSDRRREAERQARVARREHDRATRRMRSARRGDPEQA